jgi:Protein of unknown function (DUF551)
MERDWVADQIVAAGRRVGEVSDPWQPIDTAPKDGTWVLVWETGINTKYSPCEVARWYEEGSLFEAGWRNSVKKLIYATRWMPLPAAPNT